LSGVRTLRVLMIEDSPSDAELVLLQLESGGFAPISRRVETEAELRDALAEQPWDVVLADFTLPGFGALQALPLCRAADPERPFIVVSGSIGEEQAVLLMRAGASDYLMKDRLARLPSAVERELREADNRRAARRAVAEASRQMDAVRLRDRAIQAVSQGILITDPNQPDNPIIYASPGFQALTGYAPAEVLGKNCRFLQGPATDAAATTLLREAIGEARPCTVELLNYRKDGASFWNELSISPVRDEQGRLIHFVGVQTDVTQRRLLEERYRQSQKMDGIGQLAGGVAHDFNNLLTIINGFSDILLEELGPDDPSREIVTEIRAAGERSAALTRQLLAFARKQVIAPRVLDLNAVVEDAEKMLRRVLGEDVHLSASLGVGLGRVRADEGQLQQMLLNLAVNARDAMPDGGALTIATHNGDVDEAHARLHADLRPGAYVVLVVSDTGCGMSAEVKRHLFEPFFTTKGPGKGTGLGLSVVHGVITEAGGSARVVSEPGAGTTFTFYLPRIASTGLDDEAPHTAQIMQRGSETVLLVEDDDGVRSFTQHVLTGLGYQVLAATGGVNALRILRAHEGPVHLLITDVVMSDMNGRQVAEAVVALRPAIRVLFVSGYTDDAIVRRGILQDEVYFLPKPFSPLALAAKVRDVLHPRSGVPARGGEPDHA
jgi:two-component system cell cycle sensor histidine kinase/response regulator CckA